MIASTWPVAGRISRQLRLCACVLVVAAWAFAPGSAFAAAPLLKLSRSVTVHASAQAAWARIGRFDGVAAWHPAVSKDELVSGKSDGIGAERVLTLRDGGTLTDKLLGYDAKHHRYRYAIVSGTLPVSDYTATLGVKAAGRDRSRVTWSATFRRKDGTANPAPNANDAAAIQAVAAFHQAGLANLKKAIGSK